MSEAAGAEATDLAARLRRARDADRGLHAFAYLPQKLPTPAEGPLSGVTVGVKDIIETRDMPTGYGSAIDPTFRPATDASIVTTLRALGATVLGKTHTTEFAWRHPGPTVNPHDARHTPGGSSSGSAAAVAAGLVDLALGTQTVGSVIRPAAYCGIVGFKPSYGWTPRTGVHPLAWTLDHLGLFARTVAEVGRAFALCLGRDPSDPHDFVPDSADKGPDRPARIGLATPPGWARASTAARDVRDRSAERLAAAGLEIVEIALDPRFDDALDAIDTILKVEARAIHRRRIADHPDRVSDTLKSLVADGAGIAAERYAEALLLRLALRRSFAESLAGENVDAILTVPALDVAPEGLAETGDASMCAPWTLIGAPAICLPAERGQRGLPLGIQLVAPWLGDAALLRVAAEAETSLA